MRWRPCLELSSAHTTREERAIMCSEEQYRRLRLAFRELAQQSDSPDVQARWLAMATACSNLATERKERSPHAPAGGSGTAGGHDAEEFDAPLRGLEGNARVCRVTG
jgi:hypothetical protein